MLKWRWPMKKLRKLRGKRTPAPPSVPLASGEVAGSEAHLRALLAKSPAFKTPAEGQIRVAEAGEVGLAVEGCMAIPGGGVAVRGWLTDPRGQVAGLWLEIDGTLRQASFAGRMYRQDVLEQRGLLEAYPGYRTGCYLFETSDLKPGSVVVVNLHAITQTPQGYMVLTSGITVTAGHRCSLERLASEFEAGFPEAATIAGAAVPFLNGLAAVKRQDAWREKRIEATSGEPADLAVVVVVKDNFEMLHHLLAALEACGHAGRMEVVLSFQDAGVEEGVNRSVRTWRATSPFASIKTLVPFVPIGFGLAANGGVEFAHAPAIAIASDEILPPNGNWVGAALELLSAEPLSALIPPIATFEHRPFTFSNVFELAWADFEHDHSSLRDLATVEPVQECLPWACGFLVAGRELFDRAGGLNDSMPDMDMCLLEFVCRLHGGAAQLKSLARQFTHLRLPGYKPGHPAQRLWSLYALAEMIRRLDGEAAETLSPGSTDAIAQFAPSEPKPQPKPSHARA